LVHGARAQVHERRMEGDRQAVVEQHFRHTDIVLDHEVFDVIVAEADFRVDALSTTIGRY